MKASKQPDERHERPQHKVQHLALAAAAADMGTLVRDVEERRGESPTSAPSSGCCSGVMVARARRQREPRGATRETLEWRTESRGWAVL